ncbi:MAG TPA: hypothetical protein VEX13_04460 [Chloroflexia bacterium]|nr:hypothetical protein [Chloroflexia bacterium]
MFKNKPDLDRELERLEGDTPGTLLRFAGEQMKPRAEFARELEANLAKLARPVSEPGLQVSEMGQMKAGNRSVRRSEPVFTRPRIRLSLAGAGLGVVMVVMLGFAVLFSGNTQPKQPFVSPPPQFPPELGASVLVAQWNPKLGHFEVCPVDPATGVTIPGYEPIVVGKQRDLAHRPILSADSTRLFVVEPHGRMAEPYAGGTAYSPTANVLHLIDVQAWRDVTATLTSTLGTGSVGHVAFSPDGGRLALAHHIYRPELNKTLHTLALVDTGTAKVLLKRELEFNPWLVGFNQDGSQVVVYGQPDGSDPGNMKPNPVRLLLMDAATLEMVWNQPLANILSGHWCEAQCNGTHDERVQAFWTPAVVPSHDRSKLYIVHADEEKLTVVDLEARKVSTMEVREARSLFEELLSLTASNAEAKGGRNGVQRDAVLSSDGTKLYVVGRKMDAKRGWEADEPLALRVVNVENGQIVASSALSAFDVSISPDDTYLYLYSSYVDTSTRSPTTKAWRDVVDVKTLRSLKRIEDEGYVVPARRLNGQPIVLAYYWVYQVSGNYTQLAVLDPQTLEVVASWAGTEFTSWIISP